MRLPKSSLYFLCTALAMFVLSACIQDARSDMQDTDINVAKQAVPSVISLAELPDTLQPEQFRVDTMPRSIIKSFGTPSLIRTYVDSITKMPLTPEAQGHAFFTNYSSDDGLAVDNLACVFVDSRGYLWFGTYGAGVSRYDGKAFVNFTIAHGLPGNDVPSIDEDKEGNLWFGTLDGLSKYDGRTFRNFTTADGLAHNRIYNILIDRNNRVWCGTRDGGVSYYDGITFMNYGTTHGLGDLRVRCIFQDKSGDIWCGTEGGVSRFDGTRFLNYSQSDGLPVNNVISIASDAQGNLWFGTYLGVSRFDGRVFTNYSVKHGLGHTVITSIHCDKSGLLWFGTYGKGITRYDGKSFINFDVSSGLAHNAVVGLAEDDAGNLWIATYGGGASLYEGVSFTNFDVTPAPGKNGVKCITEDQNGNLWFGILEGGASRYERSTLVNFDIPQGLPSNRIYSILHENNGNMWFGTRQGAAMYDPVEKTIAHLTLKQGLVHDEVYSIKQDKSGKLWFSTDNGVSVYERLESSKPGVAFPGHITNFTTAQGLTHEYVRCIEEDAYGNMWFGTDNGVSKFDGTSFMNFTAAQGLAHPGVNCIEIDRLGNLWFGTKGGLSLLRAERLERLASGSTETANLADLYLETYTTKDGLPDNVISALLETRDGHMIVGTNRGIAVLRHGVEAFLTSDQIETFHTSTGHPIRDVIEGASTIIQDHQGVIWIATGANQTGVVRFDYEALHRDLQTPSAEIQAIRIHNMHLPWPDLLHIKDHASAPDRARISIHGTDTDETLTEMQGDSLHFKFGDIRFDSLSRWNALPVGLILPYQHNNITFDFNAIIPVRKRAVQYQYILEGYEEDWSALTSNASATFGNIREGTYTFKLKARSPEGKWSSPTEYTFRVLPPFYRTWWAYGIYGFLFFSLLFPAYKIQKQRVIRKEREKTRQRELEQAQKIREAYDDLAVAHETLKTTQAQLVHREKMASLGEMITGIAHEIQNPLNFVTNFSEVNKELISEMRDEISTGNIEEVSSIADTLESNEEKIIFHGRRADGIVKSMLQHSRTSSGQKELTDINTLAEEYMRLANHGLRAKEKSFNVTLLSDFDQQLPKTYVIRQDMGRVLLNLINNAFYSVSEKLGTPSHAYEPTVFVSTRKAGDNIEIRIKDNGIGIPQQIVDKIFQPFFTTKPTGHGTGLGLSLAYDIVKFHGGEIHVNTQEGEGAEFIIELPIVQK